MKGLGTKTVNDAMLTNRDLESIDNVIYEVKEEELKARSLIYLKTDIPAGAETYSYNKLTRRGSAKIFAHGADDVPLVDNDLKRAHVDIYSIVTGFRITLQEKRAAQMTGMSIDTAKATTARKAVASVENTIVFKGDSEYGIEGILNTTGIQTYAIPQGSSGKTTWADKTPQEIITDIRKTRSKVKNVPGMNPDTLVLPTDQYEDLSRLVTDNSSLTIMAYINEQNWFKNIISDDNLKGMGTASTNCMLVFDSSRENVELGIPLDLTRYEPIILPNLSDQINCEERTCGAIVRFPSAFCRADGI